MEKIRIVGDGFFRSTRIFLGDTDISNFIMHAEIVLDANRIPEVRLTLIGRVELPDELKVIVKANEPVTECTWEGTENANRNR